MGRYSKTQDTVLRVMAQTGKLPDTVQGRTVRRTTIEALERRGAIRPTAEGYRLTDTGKQRVVAENVDQPRTNQMRTRFYWRGGTPTFDIGQADYAFWDKARRGKAQGLEIAGLLLKPIASKKASWVLGDLPRIQIDNAFTVNGEPLEDVVNQWLHQWHSDILLAYEEAANLGDMYIALNADQSVTLIAPHVVEAIANADDYSEFVGWRVTQVYEHPTDWSKKQIVMDEFTTQGRRRRVEGDTGTSDRNYRARLPELPFIHIPNNLRANERFGHPEGEALVKALHDYNAMFDASADGVVRMGRPTPVIHGMGSRQNVDSFMNTYGETETFTLADGTTESKTYLSLTSDDVIVLGESGNFKYESPGSFTGDTERMLGLLFYLFVQHTELPEFILGTAIASSKASADAQMPAFVKWNEKEQRRAERWLIQLVRAYIGMLTYVETGRALDVTEIDIQWQPLVNEDGTLTLQAIDKAERLGVPAEYLIPHLPLDLDEQMADIRKALKVQQDERERWLSGMEEPFVQAPSNDNPPPDDRNQDESEAVA